MVTTHAPQHPKQHIQRRQAAMQHFTNCRDDLARWMAYIHPMPLKRKEEWNIGYCLLFNLIEALAALKNPLLKDRVAIELRTQLFVPNCSLDLAATCEKLFRARANKGQFARAPFSSAKPRDTDAKKGTEKPTGAAGERRCNRCQRYHVGDWSKHIC